MPALTGFMLRDLRGAGKVRSLWVFAACLLLGIALIAACGSLLHLVRDGFAQQERNLFGGDIQISQREAVSEEQLSWLKDNASVSLLLELKTMMGTEDGEFSVVELQSVDESYPLYGEVVLSTGNSIQEAVKKSEDGTWGAAFDPALVQQLSLEVGQLVFIGDLEVELRAIILEQPDRSIRADFRGPPVIMDEKALEESGLLLPTSLVDYDYRVRVDDDPIVWRDKLYEQFPDASWEIQTVEERGEIVGRRLDQVASVLLLIGFSTLLVGGLGVANSVAAYLQTKLRTIATLQSLGSRALQVAGVYAGQILLLAFLASTAGALLGSSVAWIAAQSLSERLPITPSLLGLMLPTLLAILLGTCTALAFTLPVLGRTLDMPTALLIKGLVSDQTRTPAAYRLATALIGLIGLLLLLAFVPEPLITLGFIVCIVLLLLLLNGIVQLIRYGAEKLIHVAMLDGQFALRLAVAGLYRPGASLRPMLLSLGTALTLLVTAAIVIAATFRTLNDTVPQRAPSLVLYDLQKPQVEEFDKAVAEIDGYESHTLAPLVLGRLTAVNAESLTDSDSTSRVLEAYDEHKLSYRYENIDNTSVVRGQWWANDYSGPPLVAMEDREADQLGLKVGDTLEFTIMGEPIVANLSAIYSQAQFETSFWLEAVFSDNVLEPYITRYVGSVMLEPQTDIAAQSALGQLFPNVVTVRTAKVLETSRSILSSAGLAMALIAAVSLSASVLVMASVVAVNRQRQVYEASIMHAMGTRMSVVMKSVMYEYGLLTIVLSIFAIIIGSAIAQALLTFWLKLPSGSSLWVGSLVAVGASSACLAAGALWLVSTLKISPAILLRQ